MATRLLGGSPCRPFFSNRGKGQVFFASLHTVFRGRGQGIYPSQCRAVLSPYQSLLSSPRPAWSSSVRSRSFLSWIWGSSSASDPEGAGGDNAVSSEPAVEPVERIESVSGYFGDQGAFVPPELTFPDSCATSIWELDSISAFEPSFTTMGLGGYYPWGICQWVVEFFHTTCGMPWWASVMTLAVSIRLITFPIYVYAQRSAARLNEIQPEVNRIQAKIRFLKGDGDAVAVRKAEYELDALYKKTNVSPMSAGLSAACQVPMFIGAILGMRYAAELPVRSMQYGGLFWFTDLTVADPYYALPSLAAATQYAIIKLGAEMNTMTPTALKLRKYSWILCLVLAAMLSRWPSNLVLYWASANTLGVLQSRVIRLPSFRRKFNFPEGDQAAEKLLLGGHQQQGLLQSFKDFHFDIDQRLTTRYQKRVLKKKQKHYDNLLKLSQQGKGRVY